MIRDRATKNISYPLISSKFASFLLSKSSLSSLKRSVMLVVKQYMTNFANIKVNFICFGLERLEIQRS